MWIYNNLKLKSVNKQQIPTFLLPFPDTHSTTKSFFFQVKQSHSHYIKIKKAIATHKWL